MHVAGATEAARLADGIGGWARDTRSRHSRLSRPALRSRAGRTPRRLPLLREEKAEPEAPKPAPAAAPKAPTEKHAPPPAPAQAGKILTQEPDPDAPVDLTGGRFRDRQRRTYAGGVTANNGTSTTAVRNLNAAPGRRPRRHGHQARTRGSFGPDLSQPCLDQRRHRLGLPVSSRGRRRSDRLSEVPIVVTVRADGTPDKRQRRERSGPRLRTRSPPMRACDSASNPARRSRRTAQSPARTPPSASSSHAERFRNYARRKKSASPKGDVV